MFDPTIFENVKVALEGAVYDFDFSGDILVTSRHDRVDLALMSREYRIGFRLKEQLHDELKEGADIADMVDTADMLDAVDTVPHRTKAEMILYATAKDLSGEILELSTKGKEGFGCTVTIRFIKEIDTVEQCEQIDEWLNEIWSYRPLITQKISFFYEPQKKKKKRYENTITLDFGRKINEDNIGDLSSLLTYTIHTLRRLV
ncbi:hypothetical protein [Aneurinibacillus terranovensis]|uniref:hypothetical protein n=1 Tax=Aneurinibacillus terranovensis TaxID=278991 RepID=UPI000419FA6C|nr:hypothetical protein [Aneurinibacillus terranovensis]